MSPWTVRCTKTVRLCRPYGEMLHPTIASIRLRHDQARRDRLGWGSRGHRIISTVAMPGRSPEIGRMAECWYTRHSKLFNSPAVPPVELGYFYDIGVAWRGVPNDVPRRVVTSHGLVLRFNILGFAIGQLSYAHPNDRPMKDWVWQFVFTPGF